MRGSCKTSRGMGVPPMKHGQDARAATAGKGSCKNLVRHLRRIVAVAGFLLVVLHIRADSAVLARALEQEGQHSLAALEYRRAALAATNAADAARWHWLAAHAYAAGHEWKLAGHMLDLVEETGLSGLDVPLVWLRAEQTLAERDWPAADFYFDSLVRRAEGAEWQAYAQRGRSIARLRRGDVAGARGGLESAPLEAVERYAAGRDRRPWVGGLLGLVPGLGYFYSGEIGNGVRSLLLNSLFIWGLVETAQDDQWAVFSVLAFAEFTWYSGSIYGGIDAAHRYNRRRLDAAVDALRDGERPRAVYDTLPVLTLRFEF